MRQINSNGTSHRVHGSPIAIGAFSTLGLLVALLGHAIAAERMTTQLTERIGLKGCGKETAAVAATMRLDEPSSWTFTFGGAEYAGTYATKGKKERKLLLQMDAAGLATLAGYAGSRVTTLCGGPTTVGSPAIKSFRLTRKKGDAAKIKLVARFVNTATGKPGRLRMTGTGTLEPVPTTTTTSLGPTTTVPPSSTTTTPSTSTTTTTAPSECAGLADDTPCQDDGKPCTRDLCAGGLCVHPVADAGTVCREQATSCDRAEVCDGVAADCPPDEVAPSQTPCSDDNLCTVGDTCQSGVCQPGVSLICGIGFSSCEAPGCDPERGCVPQPNGTPCGLFGYRVVGPKCVIGTVCVDGTCGDDPNASVECSDDAFCDDGDLCNGVETCENCHCQAGQNPYPFGCLDAEPCYRVGCNPITGLCDQLVPDVCGPTETCRVDPGTQLPQCVPLVVSCTTDAECADGLVCTDDICNSGTCVHLDATRAGGSCYREASETCVQCAGQCDEQTGCLVLCGLSDAECTQRRMDGNFCFDKRCQPGSPGADARGCVEFNPCDDGVGCTGEGAWHACPNCPNASEFAWCRCEEPGCTRNCDGDAACEACINSSSTGWCRFDFLGDTCSGFDAQGQAICKGVPQDYQCDFGNECTINTCDPVEGCVEYLKPQAAPCTCRACDRFLDGCGDLPGTCCPSSKSCLAITGGQICPIL
jgi:hypothetical protein